MGRPLCLDLFCCAGGAGMGYFDSGFDVVGVDIEHQPDYPFEFHQADALEFVKEHGHEFELIHASPPCQAHSALTKMHRALGRVDNHVDLIDETRAALRATGRPFVIENVQGSTVRRDLVLCGLMFGLRVFRHRYFEVDGWRPVAPPHPTHRGHRVSGWRHGVKYEGDMVAVYGDGGGKGDIPTWQEAMAIDWTSSRVHIAEAIPPPYTEFVGRSYLERNEDR